MRFVLPAIATLWGAGIVVRFALTGTDGTGAYATGQVVAVAVGVAMVVVGILAVRRRRAEH